MTLFFGLSGLIILLGLGPLLLLLWTLGVDMGTLTWSSFGIVMAMGLIDNVVSDPLYARAIQLAGETWVGVGWGCTGWVRGCVYVLLLVQ